MNNDEKTKIIKLNIPKADYEIEKSERFKKSCYILNSFLNSIKHLNFNIDKEVYFKVFKERISLREIKIKFKLDDLDNFKIEKTKKKSNIYVLYFSFNLEETNINNLERIFGKHNYLSFILDNKNNNEIQFKKLKDLNKINNIFIVILENLLIKDFEDIFKKINFKYYDIFISIDCENSFNDQTLNLIKKENNFYCKSLDDKEDLQKIENIKNDAEVLLQKLNNFFEKKNIYDVSVKLYIELTSSKVRFIDKEEINNFIEKIYEILFFMENLKVPERKYSENNENILMRLLSLINILRTSYIRNKGKMEIDKILESIREFVNNIVPIISTKIWNLIIKKEFFKE